jgi:magnesium chelatase subunit I
LLPAFAAQYEAKQHHLTERIIAAQQLARHIQIPYDFKVRISQVCSSLNVDGIRGDIVTTRAAKALAAFEGREEVAVEDVYRVIPMCLRHRLRKDPLSEVDDGERVRDMFKKVFAID